MIFNGKEDARKFFCLKSWKRLYPGKMACCIRIFFTIADKLYSQVKFKEKAKFGLLRDTLKPKWMLQQFVLSRGAESYSEIKQKFIDYSDILEMVNGLFKNNGSMGVRLRVQASQRILESRIYRNKRRISIWWHRNKPSQRAKASLCIISVTRKDIMRHNVTLDKR